MRDETVGARIMRTKNFLRALNNTITQLIGMTPNKACKKKHMYAKFSKPRNGPMRFDEKRLSYNVVTKNFETSTRRRLTRKKPTRRRSTRRKPTRRKPTRRRLTKRRSTKRRSMKRRPIRRRPMRRYQQEENQ
ncbi:hypothetical protein Glove_9g202 [Diversispora epigaea]|uniref:Uncharacterized protein n=1 Tax=Diversispora epigaea TaxID=1348612 RepID=A0A397JZM0_9GLOM|nr:hypothetical protein Glove_9g202 [Diversispora epigaea]